MGELIVAGENAEAALNDLLTNDIRGMYDGQVRYSLLPNEKGGAVDDVLVYRISATCFLVVVNASNADKDAAWIAGRLPSDVTFANISDAVAQIALQGPKSEPILRKLVKDEDVPVKYYSFRKNVIINGMRCLISRTGYTGEHGYEIYCATQLRCTRLLWKQVKKKDLSPPVWAQEIRFDSKPQCLFTDMNSATTFP